MRIGIAGPMSVKPLLPYLDRVRSESEVPAGLGGTPVLHLVRELLERGYEVTVFTLSRDVTDEVLLSGPRLKIYVGPYRLAHRARDLFKVERDFLTSAIRRENPDVVHAHWTYEYALAALATGVPTVVTAHDAPLQIVRHSNWHHAPYRLARAWMAYQVARQARYLTAVSPYVAQHFRRWLRFSRPVAIVPNGLPCQMFEVTRQTVSARERGVTYATILQGWGGLKNGQVALKAFAQVRPLIPGARLIMFGAGHESDGPAASWARWRGLDGGVEFAGELPYGTLIQRMAAEVDVLVHPSLEESFAMAVLEAMFLNVPVIAGIRSGGTPFVLGGGRYGVLVDVRSPREVAAAMLDLAREPAMRAELAARAYETAVLHFDIRVVTDMYLTQYQLALGA